MLWIRIQSLLFVNLPGSRSREKIKSESCGSGLFFGGSRPEMGVECLFYTIYQILTTIPNMPSNIIYDYCNILFANKQFSTDAYILICWPVFWGGKEGWKRDGKLFIKYPYQKNLELYVKHDRKTEKPKKNYFNIYIYLMYFI